MSNNPTNLNSLFSSNDELVNKDIAELLSLLLDGNPDENLKLLLSIDSSQA